MDLHRTKELGLRVIDRASTWPAKSVEELPAKVRAPQLGVPVAVGTFVLIAAPLYSDARPDVTAGPMFAGWMAALVAVPAAFLLAFVRTRVLWVAALAALSTACAAAPVIAYRSDDAQGGLALLLVPYVGCIAAMVATAVELSVRWWRRRSRRAA